MEEMKHLFMLSEQIGPRGATSSNEELAAYYIKEDLKKKGIGTEIQKFLSPRSYAWVYVFIYFFFLLAFFIFPTSHTMAFFICLPGLFLFKKELEARGSLNRIFARGQSQNIIGKVSSQKYPVKKVVFVAHYDSSRSGLSFHPELVKNFRSAFLITFYSMGIITLVFSLAAVSVLVNLTRVSLFLWLISFPPALVIIIASLVLIYQEIFGEDTPGANDNGSGVSVLLELAKEIKENPPDFVETWFLFTGAKEAGSLGMVNFLEEFNPDPQNTFFINVDNIGTGDLKYILEEGMLKKYSSSDKLIKWASLAIQEKPPLKVSGSSYFLFNSDATAALARGYKAITIMAMDEEGFIPNWHWPTDNISRIEKENLTLARNLAKRTLYKINEGV